MIQDIIDEVLESEPRYTLRDSVGNVLNDDVDIALKTPVVEEGTPINRALFRNLQGDLYTEDRYNTLTGHKFSTTSSVGNYWANNKPKSIVVFNNNTSNPMDTMLTTSAERQGGFNTANNNADDIGRVTIQNQHPLRINEIKIKGYGASGQNLNPKKFRIYGSNDGISWRIIYVNSTEITDTLTTLQINSTEFFDYIQLEFEVASSNSGILMNAFYISSWTTAKHVLSLNMPLSSYEKDKVVKIKGTSFKKYDANYTEATFTGGSVQPTFSDSNVATNQYGTWEVSCSRRPLDANYQPWKVFDKNSSTYYQAQGIYGYSCYVQLASLETAGNTMWAIKPSSFYLRITFGTGSATIKGYNVETQRWEKIVAFGSDFFTAQNIAFERTHTVSTNKYYSRFRLEVTAYSSSYSSPQINEFRVQSGTIRTGTVADIYAKTFASNVYLNINNNGEKLLKGLISYPNNYDLIYNANSDAFDILSQDVITGTYTGNSTVRTGSQEIILGFRPKLLIVGAQGDISYNMEWFASGDVTLGTNYNNGGYRDSAGRCELTNRGFVVSNGYSDLGDSYGYNYNGVIYKYIALK